MSQNSIITTIIVILAVTVGVYFYFSNSSTPKTDSIVYDEAKPDYSSNKDTSISEPTPVVVTDSKPATLTPTKEIIPGDSLITDSETLTNAGTSSAEGQVPKSVEEPKPEPVIVMIEYVIEIKGTVERLSKPFVIKAIDKEAASQEFAQDKLSDGSYKFESEKIFNSFSINVEGYAPVLKENLVVENNKLLVQIEMDAYASLSGTIKSFLEKPIGGASLSIEKGSFKKLIHADVQGEFKIADTLSSGLYNVSINHPQFDAKKMVIELGKGEEKIIDIKLERDALMEGIVSTSEGKPAVNMEGILKHESDQTKNKQFNTDANGRFKISKISEGKYTLEFNSMLGSLVEPLAFAKNVEMNRDFKLLPPPSISGVVVDENGKPVTGIKLYTFDDKSIVESESKEEGKFNLVLAKKGDYRVLTSSENYEVLNSTKLYSPSLEKIVIQVKKKAFLKGKVLSATGIVLTKDLTFKLINKTKKTSIPIYALLTKEGNVSIPMSTFKFVSGDDEIQVAVETLQFGKGVSLTMKVSSLSEEKEFLITLGE